jgi:hypothetical protein
LIGSTPDGREKALLNGYLELKPKPRREVYQKMRSAECEKPHKSQKKFRPAKKQADPKVRLSSRQTPGDFPGDDHH